MEISSTKNSEIEVIQPGNILFIKFMGNIEDDDYKDIWEDGVNYAVENDIENFIFDQEEVGKVSFSARGWVIIKMLPRIKKEIGQNIKVGVISSKDLINKSGVKYLVGMFEKMAGVNVNFFPDRESAVKFIIG